MKIALLGSNSFIAGYIIREFMHDGSDLTLYGVSPSPEFPTLKFNRFEWPDYSLVLPHLLEFDLIIYTAGAGIQPGTSELTGLIFELNSFLPIRILDFLSSNQFRGKIITFGSYFEIGNEKEERYYTESEVVASELPVPGDYALSKRLLTRFFASAPGLPDYYHLILPNIYGPGENPNRIIPYVIESLKKGNEINLTGGTQVRQYIHAADNAKAVRLIAGHDFPKGIYNLCNPEPVQIRSLVHRIFSIIGIQPEGYPLHFGTNQRSDTTMPFLLLDNQKALKVLNFQPDNSLEEGISTYL